MDENTFQPGSTRSVEADSETVELVRILDIGTDERRSEAANALIEAGMKALPGLLLAFSDPAKKDLMARAAEIIRALGEPAFPLLDEYLREGDIPARTLAAGALGYLGKPAVPYLITALTDKSREVRYRAASSIANIGWEFTPEQVSEQVLCDVVLGNTKDLLKIKKTAFPYLVELLGDEDYRIRVGAIKGLGEIKSVPALSKLAPLIKSEEIEVRSAVVEALGKIGNPKVIPFLVHALSDTSPYVRIEAVWSLEKLGWTPKNNQQMVRFLIAKEQWGKLARIDTEALPALIPALADENPNIRNNIFGIFIERGTAALPVLHSAQNSQNDTIRRAAQDLIERIGSNSGSGSLPPGLGSIGDDTWLLNDEEIPEDLTLTVDEEPGDESAPVRQETPHAKLKRLSALLADPDPGIRVVAIEDLRTLGAPAIDALGNALRDPDPLVRLAATDSLGQLQAAQAVPAIIRLLEADPEKNVRLSAARALGLIRDTFAIPALAGRFVDLDPGLRAASAAALGSFGKPALHILVQKIHDANPLSRSAAYLALGVMPDPGVVSMLVRGFDDPEPVVREAAARGLGTFATKNQKKFLEIIPGSLMAGSPAGRREILSVLSGLESEQVLWIAYAVREDPDPQVREKALEIIKKREPGFLLRQNGSAGEKEDEKTLSSLVRQLGDPDPAARKNADRALRASGQVGTRILLSSLAECDPEIYDTLFEILASKGDLALNELIDAIHNDSPRLRKAAVTLLGKIPQERAVYALGWVLFGEKETGIRRLAAESLGTIKSRSAIPSLVHSLADTEEVRRAAIAALGNIGGTEACEALVANIAAAGDELLPEIARALAPCGETARAALISSLAKNSPEFRSQVAAVLDLLSWQPDDIGGQIRYFVAKGDWDQIASLGLPALECLIVSFDDEVAENRSEVARIIGHLGEPARPPLEAGLSDKNPFVREGCVLALGYLGKKSEKNIIMLLRDPDAAVRLAAAGALERIGWKPRNEAAAVLYSLAKKSWDDVLAHKKYAVPALVRVLGDKDFDVQAGAIRALGKTRDNRAVPYLLLLAEKSGDIRIVQSVIAACSEFDDPKIQEFLTSSLSHPVFAIRSQAAAVLEKTGWEPPDAAGRVRFLVALQRPAALARMGGGAVPYLIGALDDDQVLGRLVITEALIAMGNEAVTALLAVLKSDDQRLYREARNMLNLVKKRDRAGSGGTGPDSPGSGIRSSESPENTAVRLDEIRTLLNTADDLTKQNAADTLARLGTAALPDLTRLAREENPEVQAAAILAIGQLKSKDALPDLLLLWKDKNPEIRRTVATAFGSIRDISTIPYLIGGFLDKSGAVRSESVSALACFGSLALREVLEATESSEPGTRAGALETLAKLPEPVILHPIIKGLSDTSGEVRSTASKILGTLAKQSGSGVLEIIIRLQSEGDLLTRLSALDALTGNDDLRVLDLLKVLIHDENEKIQRKAEEILALHEKGPVKKQDGGNGPSSVQDIPRLLRDLSDIDRDIRNTAITGLAGYGSDAVVPLLSAYSHEGTTTAVGILHVFEAMGDRGAEDLEGALEHKEIFVRHAAAEVIGRLRLFRSVPALGHALYAESDPATRAAVAEALGIIGNPQSVKPLTDALVGSDRGTRIAAIRSLGMIRDPQSVEPLLSQLECRDEDIILAAADSIRQIGEPARPGLVALLRNGDQTRKAVAANILECLNLVPRDPVEHAYYLIGKERWYDFEEIGEAAIGPLIEAIHDKSAHIRLGAANALAKLGGTRVIAPLVITLNDTSPIVRLRAENALVNIGPPVIESLETALTNGSLQYPQIAMRILQRIGRHSNETPLILSPEPGPENDSGTGLESEPEPEEDTKNASNEDNDQKPPELPENSDETPEDS